MSLSTEQQHARLIAARISAYWADQGARVKAYVVPVAGRQREGRPAIVITYGVRSNLVNGLPRG